MAKNNNAVPAYLLRQLDKQIARIEKTVNSSTIKIMRLKKLRDDMAKLNKPEADDKQ